MIIKRVLEQRIKLENSLVLLSNDGYILSDSVLVIREIDGIKSFAEDAYYQLPPVVEFMGFLDFTTKNSINLCPEVEYFLWKIHSQYVEDKTGCYNMMKYMYGSCSRWFQSQVIIEDRNLIYESTQ